MTQADIAWRIRADSAQLEKELAELREAGVIEQHEGVWVLTNFSKRQGRKQSERREKWREWQANRRARKEAGARKAAPKGESVMHDTGMSQAGVIDKEREKERERENTHTVEPGAHLSMTEPQGAKTVTVTPINKEPAVAEYIAAFGHLPNPDQVSAMLEISDIPRWHNVLHEWKLNKWREDSVGGMIDRYRTGGLRQKQPAAKKAQAGGDSEWDRMMRGQVEAINGRTTEA